MTHIWVRAECRAHEKRVGLTPAGAAKLLAAGYQVTVEESWQRAIPIEDYVDVGCDIALEGAWTEAPYDTIIFGLKDLPDDGTPLPHRHVMFGHAYKGQAAGQVLLERFIVGGGALYDLEYLVDADGRRVAAFGYWAGYAGAAISLLAWVAQKKGTVMGGVTTYENAAELTETLQAGLGDDKPTTLIIGALGRVGTGAADLLAALDLPATKWDMAETAPGAPFPEILKHDIFLNCIFANEGTPVFLPESTLTDARQLSVIGDIACDPQSDFSPIKVYDLETTWSKPVLRVHDDPVLDVTAIDNLPSLLPLESSEDFASQLLAHLATLNAIDDGVWARTKQVFDDAIK